MERKTWVVKRTTRTCEVRAVYVEVQSGGTLVFRDDLFEQPTYLLNNRDWVEVTRR